MIDEVGPVGQNRARNMESCPGSPHRLARIVAGLCVLALFLGDALRDVHLLLEAHVVCLAHGELIDAAERPGPDGAAAPTSETTLDLPVSPAIDRHDHCASLGAPSGPFRESAAPAEVTVLAAEPLVGPSSPDLPLPSTTATFAFAPKQGPPAG